MMEKMDASTVERSSNKPDETLSGYVGKVMAFSWKAFVYL